MNSKRLIARLDIKNNTVVKGIQLEGLRTLGSPNFFAEEYYINGADELFFMDVVASLYERNGLYEIIREISKNIFIPITVGGGIRNLKDIELMLRNGADKLAINTAAFKNPKFIEEAVLEFGSSTIVGCIETINVNNFYECYYDNGREPSGKSFKDRMNQLVDLGVGEISITSVKDEGTGLGFDSNILDLISDDLEIPVIIHGGFGNKNQVKNLWNNSLIDGISIAGMFHYNLIINNRLNITSNEATYFYSKSGKKPNNINPILPIDLKYFCNE